MSNRYPRESQELVLFDAVTVNGVATANFVYQLRRDGERPTAAWQTPVDVDGQPGFMLQPVEIIDTYRVWVKVSQGGQNIVIDAGEVQRT